MIEIGSIYYFSSTSMNLELKIWRNQLIGSFSLVVPLWKFFSEKNWDPFSGLKCPLFVVSPYNRPKLHNMHIDIFPTMQQIITSKRACMGKSCLSNVDLLKLSAIIREDATSTLVTHGNGATHVGTMKKYIDRWNNVTPNWLWGCFIIRLLRRKWVPLYLSAIFA